MTFEECGDYLLFLWMENILTDGEYNRLIDRFNRMVLKTHEKEENEKVDTEGHAVLL